MTNKLAVIGGSGLYDVEEFKDRELLEINTPWGKPSDKILKTNYIKFKNIKTKFCLMKLNFFVTGMHQRYCLNLKVFNLEKNLD